MRHALELLANLIDALQQESEALFVTDIGRLVALTDRKTELVADLELLLSRPEQFHASKELAHELNRVRDLARDNEPAFKAIKIGINSAKDRLNKLSKDVSIGAYTATGAPVSFDRANGKYKTAL